MPSGSQPSSSDSDFELQNQKKRMSLVEYKKKKADEAEAMEEGEVEDSDPECSIVNIKIDSISGASHRPKKARRRDDAWDKARLVRRYKAVAQRSY